MKRMHCNASPARFAGVACMLLVLCVAGMPAWAQLKTPLHIGATQPIVDEFGEKLEGQATHVGDLIQILWASNSIAYPPATNGIPDPNNPVLADGLTGIGALTSPSLVDEGIFAKSIGGDARPGNSDKLFVRVFNAPTLNTASFYGESEIFEVHGNDIFDVAIVGTTNPLDTTDHDDDGLIRSWEMSYGSDPDDPDSDDDLMSDGDEVRAKTDLGDPESLLLVVKLIGQGDSWEEFDGTNWYDVVRYSDVEISWPSAVDLQYQIQFSENYLSENPTYTNVSSVITATSTNTATVITNGLVLGYGHFRVQLVD